MRRPFITVSLLGGMLSPLQAQQVSSPPPIPSGTAVGVTVGALAGEGDAIVVPWLHVIRLGVNRAGATLGLGAWVFEGEDLLLLPDLGIGMSLSLPGATVVLKGGGSAIAVAGGSGAALFPGAHVGATLVLRLGRGIGLLFDATQRFYTGFGETVGVRSFGVGLTSLPRPRS